MSKIVFYARVSCDDQNIAHQLTQARAAGYEIADEDVYADDGVSGVSTALKDRPQGKRLFDVLRKGDVLVCRWVDRLGRNYRDVCDTIAEFMRRGVIVRTIINNMVFDGAAKNPMECAVRDALVAFMSAMAQSQAEATKEAQRAGIDHAKKHAGEKYLGRKPAFTRGQFEQVKGMLATGSSTISAIAKAAGVKRATVYRMRDNPASAEAALAVWEGKPTKTAKAAAKAA